MREIAIRILTEDPMNNRHLLDVSVNRFGVMQYSLTGELSRTSLSTSNLQTKVRLPDIINGLSLDDLVKDIISTINTGTEKVRTVVFKKELFKKNRQDDREIVKRGLAFYFNLIADKAGVNVRGDNIAEIRNLVDIIYNDLGE